jgi:hypothetical protein
MSLLKCSFEGCFKITKLWQNEQTKSFPKNMEITRVLWHRYLVHQNDTVIMEDTIVISTLFDGKTTKADFE